MTYAPNVLLLDGDDVLRKATALLLKQRGADVSSAATLEEAITLSQQRAHDVALIDLSPSMPQIAELLRRLRREGTAPARIVVSVDYAPSPVDAAPPVEEARGLRVVLVKPYPFERLVDAIFGATRVAQGQPRPG